MIYEDDCIDSSQTDIFTLARHRSNTTVLHGQWNCDCSHDRILWRMEVCVCFVWLPETPDSRIAHPKQDASVLRQSVFWKPHWSSWKPSQSELWIRQCYALRTVGIQILAGSKQKWVFSYLALHFKLTTFPTEFFRNEFLTNY